MDKFPVCWNGKAVGELAVEQEPLHTCFTVRSALPKDGLWAAWLIGERGEFRLGILEPEDCIGKIRRRFSDRMVTPLGTFLRGELRPVRLNQDLWEPVSKPEELFRIRQLPEELRVEKGMLIKQWERGRWIAIPYDKEKRFPLIDLFCFAEFIKIDGRNYLAFCFDRQERIVFGESRVPSGCQHLEKN